MNDNIFVIVKGRYSDWQIMGYVDSAEQAKRICDFQNENKQDEYEDDCYYITVPKIVLYGRLESSVYKYGVCIKDGAVSDFCPVSEKSFPFNPYVSIEQDDTVIFYFWAYEGYRTYDTEGKEKILRIGRDKWAEYRAAQEGIL